MTRNLVEPETAELNRASAGGLTFNAPITEPAPVAFTVAVVRIGDHAHLDVDSGRAYWRKPEGVALRPEVSRSHAGRLILPWHEWEVLRAMLDDHPNVHVAEVESPTLGQIERHAG